MSQMSLLILALSKGLNKVGASLSLHLKMETDPIS
jgi:hypothetical protein